MEKTSNIRTSDKDAEVATSEEFGVVSRRPLPINDIIGSWKTYGISDIYAKYSVCTGVCA